jgi:hypothetical protein
MGFFDLLNHLLNFAAPALFVGALVAFAAPSLAKKWASARSRLRQAAINSGVAIVVLLAGLWFFGHDGKMATYGALVLAVASCQWWASRG